MHTRSRRDANVSSAEIGLDRGVGCHPGSRTGCTRGPDLGCCRRVDAGRIRARGCAHRVGRCIAGRRRAPIGNTERRRLGAGSERNPDAVPEPVRAGRAALWPGLGDPGRDRQGRVRSRSRSGAGMYAARGGQPSRCRRPDAVPRLHMGDIRGRRRRRRSPEQMGSYGRDLRSSELSARVRSAVRLRTRDPLLQPRELVCHRG